MGLSKRAVQEFKKLYSQEFGERISDDKARELGENLLALFRVIHRPIDEDTKENRKRKY
jgi:hypothetical protein